jgi:hypothetical protein
MQVLVKLYNKWFIYLSAHFIQGVRDPRKAEQRAGPVSLFSPAYWTLTSAIIELRTNHIGVHVVVLLPTSIFLFRYIRGATELFIHSVLLIRVLQPSQNSNSQNLKLLPCQLFQATLIIIAPYCIWELTPITQVLLECKNKTLGRPN